MNKHELAVYAWSIINDQYGGVQSSFAQKNDLSPAYVNDFLKGRREPGQKILDILGVKKNVTYQKVDRVY